MQSAGYGAAPTTLALWHSARDAFGFGDDRLPAAPADSSRIDFCSWRFRAAAFPPYCRAGRRHRVTDAPEGKSSYTGLWVFLGLAGYVTACVGGIYLLTGEIVAESGFKALVAGTLGSLFAILILGALASALILDRFKSDPAGRARAAMALSGVLLLAVASFAWFEFQPLAARNPSSFYGAPQARYEVTFASGAQEIRTGAQLGTEEWSWWVGFYFSILLVGGASGLWMFGSNLLASFRIPESAGSVPPDA